MKEETFMDITGDAIAGLADSIEKPLLFLLMPVCFLAAPVMFICFALGSSGIIVNPTNHWIGDIILIMTTIAASLFYYKVLLGESRKVIAYRVSFLVGHILITSVSYAALYFKFDTQPDWRAWTIFVLTLLCYAVALRTETQDANG